MHLRLLAATLGVFSLLGLAGEAGAKEGPVKSPAWRETLLANFASGPLQAVARAKQDFPEARLSLDVVADWIAQDKLDGGRGVRPEVIEAVIGASSPAAQPLRERLAPLKSAGLKSDDPRWAELYLDACRRRRLARLRPHQELVRRVVFTKHYDLGGSHYAYTEGQSDAQNERHFKPGAALCLLELEGGEPKVRTLLEDPQGVIRDPDTSCDGKRILFSWKKSLDEDDYHLYEMTVADGRVRQLTSGLGFADYEGDYTEAMNDERIPRYLHFLQKRHRWHAQEAANIEALVRDRR